MTLTAACFIAQIATKVYSMAILMCELAAGISRQLAAPLT